MKYAAVIAAAGLSAESHGLKPMMCLDEEPIISKIIRGFQEVGADEIVVVTGYKSKILGNYLLSSNIHVVENTRYAETKMFDSLLLGLHALHFGYDYIFLTPTDVPLVQVSTLHAMTQARGGIICPVCKGSPGHPIMIHSSLVPHLERHNGVDGLQGALLDTKIPVTQVLVDDPGILLDVNTPEDFKRLRRTGRKNTSDSQLWPDVHICIFKADVVLSPEIAQFLNMIDHTNTIQDACSCMHISYSKGWTLLKRIEKDLGYSLVERSSGGPDGGASRITARGRQLLTAYMTYQKQIRELSVPLFQQLFPPELH